MKIKKSLAITIAIILATVILAMTLIIGSDTSWGKVEITRMTLTTADGDEISAMLYKPKTATAENKAPGVVMYHGGNDMLEHTGQYALELARRGYVVINFDYTGSHYSDIASGTGEKSSGGDAVLNTMLLYDFVDQSKISVFGHSMGGMFAGNFAKAHEDKVALYVALGTMPYKFEKSPNYDYVVIIGDSDESVLNKTNNYLPNYLSMENIKRAFNNDFTTEKWESLPDVVPNKEYVCKGEDGNDYVRATYMPSCIHAYYCIDNESVRSVIYAFTSNIGVGKDAGVNSYEDINKIGLIWGWKDVGYALEYLAILATMFVVATELIKARPFESLVLQPNEQIGFKKKSWQWWIALVLLLVIPALLYYPGVKDGARKLFGLDITKIWLIGGTANCYVTWQWLVALAMLGIFLVYHFTWGKKHGENYKTYGFSTSDTKKFDITYIFKALLYGIVVVGSGYLLMAIISKYTQQGLRITTLQMSTLKNNRVLCWPVYFVYLIPYFLCTSLAFKSLGIKYDGSTKTIVKNVALTTAISIAGLVAFWAYFVIILGTQHRIIDIFRENLTYAYGIAMMPLCLGITVGNALNTYVSSKTNSTFAGLCTAILWGVWTLCSTGGMTRYTFWG